MSIGTAKRCLFLSLLVGALAWLTAAASEFWELFLCVEEVPVTSADFELYPGCSFRSLPGIGVAWALACVGAVSGGVGWYVLRSRRAALYALPSWVLALPPTPLLVWYLPGYIASRAL
jgi:hypothetical protein